MDAFAYSWKEGFHWVVPPISMMCNVVEKIIKDKAKGVLIFPLWKKALFWPLLFSINQPNYILKDWIIYSQPKVFFVKGSYKKSVFAQEKFSSDVMLAYFDATY